MTKAEIVNEIYQKTGIEKAAIQAAIDEFMAVVKDTMKSGENVYLRGFGTFEVKHKADRYQLIKQGTDKLFVPAHNEPAFKPCKEFKDSIK